MNKVRIHFDYSISLFWNLIKSRIFHVGFMLSVFTILITWKDLPYFDPDSSWYVKLAEGRVHEVIQPFSSRILHPTVVRLLSLTGIFDIHESFFLVGLLSLIIFCTAVLEIIHTTTGYSPYVAALFFFSPLLLTMFKIYYTQDLFHGALTALFFISMVNYQFAIGLLLLFFLYLTRESTIILGFVFIFLSLKNPKPRLVFGGLMVSVLGWAIISFITHKGQSNIHNLSLFFYWPLKATFNFLRNLIGIETWVNTSDYCVPLLTWEVPNWFHLGFIHRFGICDWNFRIPLKTIELLLTLFGISPTLVLFYLIKEGKKVFTNNNLWFVIALIYGFVNFFIGPAVGVYKERYIGYAWPAFWLATPVIMAKYYHFDAWTTAELLFFHVFLCWYPWVINNFSNHFEICELFILPVALFLHYLTFCIIFQKNNTTFGRVRYE